MRFPRKRKEGKRNKMLLIHDQKSLSILKSSYNFGNEQASTNWDRSVQFLKELSAARRERQDTHLEASIEVYTYNPDDQASVWTALSWIHHIGTDWESRGSTVGRTISGINYIRYWAGKKDRISRNLAIGVLDLESEQDWKTVTKLAIETLV